MSKMFTKQFFFSVLVVVLGLFSTMAWAQKGTITGKIVDAKTGETLPGATVYIASISQGASADMDGIFTIPAVAEGTYQMTVKYISYNPKTLTDVKVTAGKAMSVNVTLDPVGSDLKEVEIVATVNRETVNAMLLQQKNSITVSDGISAETIKRSPDRNTGEALKRVSGTSIQDNKFAIIRGLSDRYNTALINGFPLPTTEPDRRAFSFDLFPSNMVDNIVITKTASADLPGEFAGGIISVNTKDVPDENFYSLSLGGGYNSQSTLMEYKSQAGGKYDFLGIDDGKRSLPAGFPTLDELRLTTDKDKRLDYARMLPNDWAIKTNSAMPMSQNYQFSMGQKFLIGGKEAGSIFSLSYSNNYRTQLINRRDFGSVDTARSYDYNDRAYKNNVLWGALWNVSYKFNPNNRINIQNAFTVNAENSLTERTGYNFENQREVRKSAMMFSSNKLSSTQVIVENLLPESKIKMKWGGSFSGTNATVPDRRVMSYDRDMSDANAPYTANIGQKNAEAGSKFYSALNENLASANFNITIPFKWMNTTQNIKLGVWEQYRKRSFEAYFFGYVVNNLFTNNDKLLQQGQDSIFASKNIGKNGFSIDQFDPDNTNYTSTSEIRAGYIMFDNTLFKHIRLGWGVRLEHVRQRLNSVAYSMPSISTDTSYLNVLPSANATIALTESSNLRVSASRTVSRPEFRELSPFSYYDFVTSSSVIGNPKLQSATINNYDVRYEIYPGMGQLLAVSIFAKSFTNPIERVVIQSGAQRLVGFQNADKATLYGAELEFRKKLLGLTTIWKQFENVSFSTNLAYINSEVRFTQKDGTVLSRPLQYQSPYVINAGLTYQNPNNGLNASVLFNQIGRRLVEVGTQGYEDIYEAPRPILDLQVGKTVFKGADLKIMFSDIFRRSIILYQDQNKNGKYDEVGDTRLSATKLGSNFSFSFLYRF